MPNPMIHWELMVEDPQRAQAFYRRVFDWTFDDASPDYTLIDPGAPPGGGMLRRPRNVPMSSLHVYFEVADLDRTLVSAVEAGATVIVPRMAVPGVGWFAMFLDPERIPVGVMQRHDVEAGAPADPIC
ncbi:MAG TPA: VOC family protein [Kofleriaceae bacterium]|nr:VOC family protein [Kofleriaceae bacterium]